MAKGVMVVESRPEPAREDEFNRWYREVHVPEVLAVPGFVSVRRFKLRPRDVDAQEPPPTYLAVYDVESEDLGAPLAELAARSAAGQTQRSDAMSSDPPPVVRLFELVD
ncbi:MAG TPA: DUF4286 family protein [Acidimicrobiales bacterium]|nr:DUF4286 family protein [Acidimicrobiales bacterium]